MVLQTDRGFEDPAVVQLAVFLQNRVGQLREVLKCFEVAKVIVVALSVTDSADFAILRVVVDQPEVARRSLQDGGFSISESTVLAVELPDPQSGLLAVTRMLIQAEVNIHYAYPMFVQPRGKGVVVVHVDALASAVECLRKGGFHFFDEQDLTAC